MSTPTVTLTAGATTVQALLRLEVESTRPSPTTIHDLLGGGTSVTVGAAGARRGKAQLLFNSAATSLACENLLRGTALVTITETGVATMSMRVAIHGEITRTKIIGHRDMWTVGYEWAEVPA